MKQFLILLVFSCILSPLFSQVDLGLKFGVNFSKPKFNTNTSSLEKFKESTLFHLGLASRLPINDNWNLKFELFYVLTGINGRPQFSRLALQNTVALPGLIEFRILPKLFIYSGMEFDYVFSRFFVDGLEFSKIPNLSGSKLNLDIGISGGLSYQFSRKWILDLRYNRELNSELIAGVKTFERTFYLTLVRYFARK